MRCKPKRSEILIAALFSVNLLKNHKTEEVALMSLHFPAQHVIFMIYNLRNKESQPPWRTSSIEVCFISLIE